MKKAILCGFQEKYISEICNQFSELDFKLIISQPDSSAKAKLKFPETIVLDRNELRLGNNLSELCLQKVDYCDMYIKNQFLPYLEQTLAMFSRMDPTGILSYDHRMQLINRFIGVFSKFIQNENIQIYISREIPHFPAEYILARLVEIHGGTFYTSEFVEYIEKRRTLSSISNKCIFPKQYLDEANDEAIRNVISKIRDTSYKQAQATSIKELLALNNVKLFTRVQAFIYFLLYSLAFWKGIKSTFSIILSKKHIETFPSRIRVGSFFYLQRFTIAKLQKFYDGLTSSFVLPDKFIYFAPNYQPEATTLPDGAGYHDILNLVKMLSANLPNGVKLVYKEHPITFNRPFKVLFRGSFSRSNSFWQEIKNLPNVELAPIHFDTFELIDNSLCVSAIVGSVSIEAGLRGKQCIIFGNAWHETLPFVHKVESEEQLRLLLNSQFFDKKVTDQEIIGALRRVAANCYDLDLYDLLDKGDKTVSQVQSEVSTFINDIRYYEKHSQNS